MVLLIYHFVLEIFRLQFFRHLPQSSFHGTQGTELSCIGLAVSLRDLFDTIPLEPGKQIKHFLWAFNCIRLFYGTSMFILKFTSHHLIFKIYILFLLAGLVFLVKINFNCYFSLLLLADVCKEAGIKLPKHILTTTTRHVPIMCLPQMTFSIKGQFCKCCKGNLRNKHRI